MKKGVVSGLALAVMGVLIFSLFIHKQKEVSLEMASCAINDLTDGFAYQIFAGAC